MMSNKNIELLVLIVLSILMVSPALVVKNSLIGEGVDLYGTIWFYEWIYESVRTGGNPSHTDLFFYPYGKDIFGHTGNNFIDAVMAAPFLAIFGFPLFQPIFYGFILFLNAFAFRKLAYTLFDSFHARLGTSVLVLFSPYVLSELIQGRPTQALLCFSILSIHYFLQMVRTKQVWDAVKCGIFAALQGWTYWYGGYFLGIVLVVFSLVYWSINNWKVYTVSLLTCLLCISPAILGMIWHMNNTVIPGLHTPEWNDWSIPIMDPSFSRSYLVGYLLHEPWGMKMFGLVSLSVPTILALWFARKQLFWWVALIISLLVATGPVYMVGDEVKPLYHYIFLYKTLPFFSRLWFPYRMVSLSILLAIIGIGLMLNQLKGKWSWCTLFIVFVHIVLQTQTYCVPLLHHSWIEPKVYSEMKREPGAIIELPIGFVRRSILWQSQHSLPTFGGMGENLPLLMPKEHRMRLKSSLFRYFQKVHSFPEKSLSIPPLQDALSQGFRYVTLDMSVVNGDYQRRFPMASEKKKKYLMIRLHEILGKPSFIEGPLWVWDLEKRVQKPTIFEDESQQDLYSESDFERYLRLRSMND